MALIEMGTHTLNIGESPKTYTPLIVNGKDLYIIYAEFTIDTPSNVYSEVIVRGRFSASNMYNSYSPDYYKLAIRPGTYTFLIAIPEVVANNTTFILEAERIPLIFGSSDTAGTVTLRFFYDDNQIEKL